MRIIRKCGEELAWVCSYDGMLSAVGEKCVELDALRAHSLFTKLTHFPGEWSLWDTSDGWSASLYYRTGETSYEQRDVKQDGTLLGPREAYSHAGVFASEHEAHTACAKAAATCPYGEKEHRLMRCFKVDHLVKRVYTPFDATKLER